MRSGVEESGRGWRWRWQCCLLPPAAGLLVILFMFPQLLTGSWSIRKGTSTGLDFKSLLCKVPDEIAQRFVEGLPKTYQGAPAVVTVEDMNAATGAAGLTAWRLATSLSLVVLLAGLVVAWICVWQALGDSPRWKRRRWAVAVSLPLLIAMVVCGVLIWPLGKFDKVIELTKQFLDSIQSRVSGSDLRGWEVVVTSVGYVAGCYIHCASGALLLPGRAKGDALDDVNGEAERVAARMRLLRLLLYVGAVMLAVTTLRVHVSYRWALDYLPPLAALGKDTAEALALAVVYQRLESLASNIGTALSVQNTVALAAIYVPSALILRARAEDIADAARKATSGREGDAQAPGGRLDFDAEGVPAAGPVKKEFDREKWMRERGLVFPLKDHLGRIAAILSPLLAGPVAELLSLLKG